MNINKFRSILYFAAKILGDVNAVQKGKIGQRIVRRTAGRASAKFLQKIFRYLLR
ncbi:Hypothetical protein IALB_1206 [Ignavibacterium album JCM 16511]|uniref:Uncharacterized protein n=1 Tax=Ignavibacterium album (strain DSM 19864 / JCM 16511 / NBRC 101810 / Mat9-16) TaxID=945713 RepID=I0AIW0_IGNAJ|nr:hypothetical protein [Ignavibacterium album]AFH48917.1 Hypothetical protein IALB_1206 [Ignavibacterium album JCM 16511]